MLQIPDLYKGWRHVLFAIDTGASHTTLHPRAATAMAGLSPNDLDPANWGAHVEGRGVGGTLRYMIQPARYTFGHFDSNELEIIDGDIQIGELTAGSELLPSLLGWDLLQYFRIVFEGRESVTLERLQ
jgi:hypothetical protein